MNMSIPVGIHLGVLTVVASCVHYGHPPEPGTPLALALVFDMAVAKLAYGTDRGDPLTHTLPCAAIAWMVICTEPELLALSPLLPASSYAYPMVKRAISWANKSLRP